MQNTKILILEDDMIIAADISLHLTRMGYEIQGILTRGEEVLKTIQDHTPDIVLVDIQLKGDLDGVETAHQINALNLNISIIFLTANSDEATFSRAKTTKPSAFITKPFKRLDLARAVELAVVKKQEHQKDNAEVVEASESENEPTPILNDRIFVKSGDLMVKIFVEDILYAEAHRNYCKIYTAAKDYLMTLPLNAFESKLSASHFLRIHRSYVINLKKVDALSDQCENVNISGKHIPVSRSSKNELVNRLKLI